MMGNAEFVFSSGRFVKIVVGCEIIRITTNDLLIIELLK